MKFRFPVLAIRSLLFLMIVSHPMANAYPVSVAESAEAAGLFCTMDHLSEGIRWAENQNVDFDKFKHCAVSCYLTLRCSAVEVLAVGALKEFKDLFDDGNAEVADLQADRFGIALVTNGKADHDRECSLRCERRYPKK